MPSSWRILNKSSPELINSRINYLESLKNLNKNWISGKSTKPSYRVLKEGKSFLKNFKNHFNLYPHIPKLIMSPKPLGGIGFEITFDSLNSIFISIFNNYTVEYTVLFNGEYNEKKVAIYELFDRFIQDYRHLQRFQ